jgi:Flp pilus assembly pilin Flp
MNHELEIELQEEIDANRRAEYGLLPKALIALLVISVLVVIRVVFFT